LTSSYVEGAAERNPMLQRGYSRDQRADCKQLVIALIVNVEGFPFSYETSDGNRADVTTLETILRWWSASTEKRAGCGSLTEGSSVKRIWRHYANEADIIWWGPHAESSRSLSESCSKAAGNKCGHPCAQK